MWRDLTRVSTLGQRPLYKHADHHLKNATNDLDKIWLYSTIFRDVPFPVIGMDVMDLSWGHIKGSRLGDHTLIFSSVDREHFDRLSSAGSENGYFSFKSRKPFNWVVISWVVVQKPFIKMSCVKFQTSQVINARGNTESVDGLGLLGQWWSSLPYSATAWTSVTILIYYWQKQDPGGKCKLALRYANRPSDLLKLMNPSRRLDDIQDPWSYFWYEASGQWYLLSLCFPSGSTFSLI